MKVVPPEAVVALRHSHTKIVRADIIRGGLSLATDLPIESGTVHLDWTNDVRGSIDVTLAGPELVPYLSQHALAPFGQELWLRMGILTGTGTEITWPMGVYRLDEMRATDTGDITLTVTGRDRAAAIAEAKTIDSYVIPPGTNYGTAIANFVWAGVPWVPINFEATTAITPQIVWPENTDRLSAAIQMAAAIGMELFLDGLGVLTMRTVIRPAPSPAAVVVEGDDGILVSMEKTWSRADSPNGVIVTGENNSVTPCRGQALDLDPRSATYWNGPYGRVPMFISSPLVVDDAQCAVMAQGELARSIGVVESLTLGAVPDPRIEPGDTIFTQRFRLGVAELAMVDSVSVPLGVDGVMQLVARTRQVIA